MIYALLVSALIGMAAFLTQHWWAPNQLWIAYVGALVFSLSVLLMLVLGVLGFLGKIGG